MRIILFTCNPASKKKNTYKDGIGLLASYSFSFLIQGFHYYKPLSICHGRGHSHHFFRIPIPPLILLKQKNHGKQLSP